jgi:pyruvate dehydrogenase E2 component (dihydrolipoamide acetyltransferase)
MATEVLLPKQGNTVEACIILEWRVKEGDKVAVGDIVCEAETDKSTIEVESTAEGTVLKLLYQEGEEAPVMTPILIVGEEGESYDAPAPVKEEIKEEVKETTVSVEQSAVSISDRVEGVSPRAKALAEKEGVDISKAVPTGPKGRVIERDIASLIKEGHVSISPVAKEALKDETYTLPEVGSGIGGRILSFDLIKEDGTSFVFPGPVVETAVKGIRKVTASRMHQSLATTAQFTLNAYADATQLQKLRNRFKNSDEKLGLQRITINDIILFAVSRTLQNYKFMNSHYLGDKIVTFEHVHLGSAVDTPRGLLVPVVRFADQRSLKGISDEFKSLAKTAIDGKATVDQLSGSTFTVTNLGAMGIESFTPVLNVPEVAILGVGTISLRAIDEGDESYSLVPHVGLSLTIDHQGVDGAPAARFLKELCDNIASIDLLMAL